MQKVNQKVFRVEKAMKRKDEKLCLSGKGTIILLTVGLIKNIYIYKSVNICQNQNL